MLKSLLQRTANAFGFEVRRKQPALPPGPRDVYLALLALRDMADSPEAQFLRFCLPRLADSKAQLLQDLFVVHEIGEGPGYFVEFGAADGVMHSNTLMLERKLGWSGVVAEPARHWHAALRTNRRCAVSTDCVWKESGQRLAFAEPVQYKELSSLAGFAAGDKHAAARQGAPAYDVPTVSLLDLLAQHGAPRRIDYLSVDTEGSELEILKAFDFGAYDVRCITVEHNFTAKREAIHALLAGHGFRRKFESLSSFDDWYVRA